VRLGPGFRRDDEAASFRREPESSFSCAWVPAFAGTTGRRHSGASRNPVLAVAPGVRPHAGV